MNLQPKLLRALQEREIFRVGGITPIHLNVRIIAATNQDLKELIRQNVFRKDLYYRLSIITLFIPPLRDRSSDIPMFASLFLSRLNRKYKSVKYLSPQAMETLMIYDWPGNVRELENVIERLIIFCGNDTIGAKDVESVLIASKADKGIKQSVQERSSRPYKDSMAEFEKQVISRALQRYGSTYKAAKALGIGQSTLWAKAKNYDLVERKMNQ
jgi:transcriptional regulator with PAS, ATPase and Fis domain